MSRLILETASIVALGGLAFYGCLGFFTLVVFWRHRNDSAPEIPDGIQELPHVTVQLPIFNERYVIDRLIRATAELQYPRNRLQIQVLDDSVDDTTGRVAELVAHYRERGVNIGMHHRTRRDGYKAGALAGGLGTATGEYIAIFDADFEPKPDFLQRTIPHFLNAPDLGLIQTRWGHLNASESALTAAQALALDKHFAMEQTVRFQAELFPKFNGTAGIWRRSCLEDAGGWQSDTVCEDLCLSTRAVLRGWRFRFLPQVVAPAELPASIAAYKNQQARWARGSTQCLIKFGKQILCSQRHRPLARLYALLSMAAYCTSLFLLILLLAQVPMLFMGVTLPPWLGLLSIAGVGQPILFILSQQVLYRDWKWRLRHLPSLLLIAIGLTATISRAVLQARTGKQNTFVRTPKRGSESQKTSYKLPFDAIIIVELFLALYASGAIVLALWTNNLGSLPFLISCALGFAYVARATLLEQLG